MQALRSPTIDNPRGTVIGVIAAGGKPRAVVAVDSAACPRCAAGRGCGAGVFGGAAEQRKVEAEIADGVVVVKGDTVELVLAPERLLTAAWLAYGLPLVGALVTAAAAAIVDVTEVLAALAALAGLVAGGVLARRRLLRDDCLRHFVPIIERRLEAASARA